MALINSFTITKVGTSGAAASGHKQRRSTKGTVASEEDLTLTLPALARSAEDGSEFDEADTTIIYESVSIPENEKIADDGDGDDGTDSSSRSDAADAKNKKMPKRWVPKPKTKEESKSKRPTLSRMPSLKGFTMRNRSSRNLMPSSSRSSRNLICSNSSSSSSSSSEEDEPSKEKENVDNLPINNAKYEQARARLSQGVSFSDDDFFNDKEIDDGSSSQVLQKHSRDMINHHTATTTATRQRLPARKAVSLGAESYSDNSSVDDDDDDDDKKSSDLDVQASKPPLDSESMLANLGEYPSSAEIANVAAVRAKEYVNEILFADGSDSGGRQILDRKKWDSIPQYAKSDLMVRKHLGKGSFSDAFEVSVTVKDESKVDPLDLSDKDDLDRLLEAKFSGSFKRETVFTGSFKKEETINEARDEEEEDLDKEIEAMFGTAPPSISKDVSTTTTTTQGNQTNTIQPIKRPCHTRRQTIDSGARPTLNKGAAKSFCVRKSAHQPAQKIQMTYAMKCLRPQIRSNAEQFIIGVEDLLHETAILASLDHPNIIKIHGRAVTDSFRLSDGYFILLDRLQDTLDERIVGWKQRQGKASKQPITLSQLKTACSIADAMSYLHSNDIMLRDLKPANVGFDSMGVLKLFDFGFAIGVGRPPSETTSFDELDQGGGDFDELELDRGEDCDDEAPHLLYDKCGTPRYMAPEVALNMGYSLPADVHSFGILLWEMCALKLPFSNIKSSEEFTKTVFEKGARPKLSKCWPRVLTDTMSSCWSSFPGERPTMAFVKSMLAAHIREVSSLQQQSNGNAGLRKSFMFRRMTG